MNQIRFAVVYDPYINNTFSNVATNIEHAICQVPGVHKVTKIDDDPIPVLYQCVDPINLNEPSEWQEVWGTSIEDALLEVSICNTGHKVTDISIVGYARRPPSAGDDREFLMLEGQTEFHGGYMMLIRSKEEGIQF